MKSEAMYKTDWTRTCKQCFIIACVLVLALLFIERTNATSVYVTKKEVWFYKPLPYNSALQVLCENSFIGYEWKPENAKKCKHIWRKWTNEILQSNK